MTKEKQHDNLLDRVARFRLPLSFVQHNTILAGKVLSLVGGVVVRAECLYAEACIEYTIACPSIKQKPQEAKMSDAAIAVDIDTISRPQPWGAGSRVSVSIAEYPAGLPINHSWLTVSVDGHQKSPFVKIKGTERLVDE